ncbi:hypothetical protein P171DRAFT_431436 [Karstenula rhodostoma CBS 690.94]|uniref:Uncharacterized protein n=1 Tax=Karstenula rhodostoma CBS 690.94 TaxID=1392251 RepID=A0A9P4PK30_9PLEO|nr:hypothetical protein P171DRAFT_431436 [Karstenula rhodostoma CBS 690.94]
MMFQIPNIVLLKTAGSSGPPRRHYDTQNTSTTYASARQTYPHPATVNYARFRGRQRVREDLARIC